MSSEIGSYFERVARRIQALQKLFDELQARICTLCVGSVSDLHKLFAFIEVSIARTILSIPAIVSKIVEVDRWGATLARSVWKVLTRVVLSIETGLPTSSTLLGLLSMLSLLAVTVVCLAYSH